MSFDPKCSNNGTTSDCLSVFLTCAQPFSQLSWPVQIVLAAVCRWARTPDGQNAGLPSLRPTLLVTIASGTLELPG
eukprot:COSAG02_NODE_39659_length_414_cov_1.028571_2_plen_75_part_01